MVGILEKEIAREEISKIIYEEFEKLINDRFEQTEVLIKKVNSYQEKIDAYNEKLEVRDSIINKLAQHIEDPNIIKACLDMLEEKKAVDQILEMIENLENEERWKLLQELFFRYYNNKGIEKGSSDVTDY